LDDTVGFSINSLIVNSGYKPNRHKNKICDKFISILNEFASDLYFEVTLNLDKFDTLENFGIIFIDELDKILNYKSYVSKNKLSTSMSSAKLLLILSYIRIHKSRRSTAQNKHPNKKPEIYYRRYIDLAADINIHADTVSLGVKILTELNIIAYKSLPRRRNENGDWRSFTNIFVDKYDGWEQELLWGVELLLKQKTTKKG
jgi:hypothetical protein